MKFTTIAAAAVALFAVSSRAEPVTWTGCFAGSTDLVNPTFQIAGEMPCAKKDVCATLTGTLSTPIVEGTMLTIRVKYLGRSVRTYRRDFCQLMADNGSPCPIAPGPKTFTACINDWNAEVVNVPTNSTVEILNGSGSWVTCLSAPTTNKQC
ncbi:hypothetical protein BGZ47_000952 [Haplosporangium gracile]|nr:hypothetical protein BGZ47_000952 [Haplosporangium gracile]